MKTRVFETYQALCAGIADAVAVQLAVRPASTLVFPTGNTPLGLFRVLVERAHAGTVDFGRARIVILDEYEGLGASDSRSLAGWLDRELLAPVGIPASRVIGFERGPDTIERSIAEWGGLDLVILGLGPNGHLALNEPGSPFDSRSRAVSLTPASIASNAAYWGGEARVPRQGLTLGLGTITEARSIILMVSGKAKAGILARTLRGPVGPEVPATSLRTLAQAVLFADAAAMGEW